MSSMFFCEKEKVVWEKTFEAKSMVIYKKDKNGNLMEDETGKYAVEMDNNGETKKKVYAKTIHVYKGFPSYGLQRKNMPCNKKDEYYINSSVVGDAK